MSKLDKIKERLLKAKEMVLEKAIKPGPTLDYAKINPRENASVSPEAKTTADTGAASKEAGASTIDYQSNPMQPPKRYAGAAERAKAVRAKIDAQANESALDTIQARQKMKKAEGVLIDKEQLDKDRMVAKSEDEPHADPKHEQKEKDAANAIKQKAQKIINLHK